LQIVNLRPFVLLVTVLALGVAFPCYFFSLSGLIRYLRAKSIVPFFDHRSLGVCLLLDSHCSASHCLALMNPDFQVLTLVAKVNVPPYHYRKGCLICVVTVVGGS
jgi:hypothetical protein